MNKRRFSKDQAKAPLIIITGLSGAGKSTAMRFLEDLGCYCLDNLPPSLIPAFINLYEQSDALDEGVAIACDVRSGEMFDDLASVVMQLEKSGIDFEVVYFECSTQTLIRRFKEVRRNHPLQVNLSMEEAIAEERQVLQPIRAISTRTIDTSEMTAAGLRETMVRGLLGRDAANTVTLEFVSFGFKYGLPRDVDFVFDVRFLPNPFYQKELRNQNGEDKAVFEYVMSVPNAEDFFKKITNLLDGTLESFFEVGKTAITVGIGCTGGRHRSVAFAKRLNDEFAKKGCPTTLAHRDVLKPQN